MTLPEELKIICSWCGAHMSGPTDSEYVSHGICKECFAKLMEEDA